MYKIKVARKDKGSGKIIHELIDGQPDISYLDIRAGLAWPYQNQPGYWLILGQYDEKNTFGKNSLVLLDEGKAKDLDKLFSSLTDTAVRLKNQDVYADMSEENNCYREEFSRFCDEGNIRRVFMKPAPYVENFEYGTGLIREYVKDKALEIDRDSIIARALGQIPETALEENQLAQYYSVHALRFVLAAFVKNPWREPLADLDYGDPNNYPGFYKGINF
jgi:hypothetical protein